MRSASFCFLGALLLAAGSAAQAHTHLVSATPAANSTVENPSSIQLRFSGKLRPTLSKVNLFMVGMGARAHPPMKVDAKTSFSADGKTIIMSMKPLPAGTYKVDYHCISMDTHKARGSYTFNVK